MKKYVIFALLWIAQLSGQEDKRPYFTSLSPQEGRDIQYVVDTLGNTSTVGLLFKKKTLEQAGGRIEHVHPLRFLSYILSNPRLKSSFVNMRGMAWRNFQKGLIGSLQKAFARHNLNDEMLKDFAHNRGINVDKMKHFIKNQEWKSFIDFIRRQA